MSLIQPHGFELRIVFPQNVTKDVWELFVLGEIRWDEDELWTEFLGDESWYCWTDSVFTCDIIGCADNRVVPSDCDGFISQLWPVQHFAGDIEHVKVQMCPVLIQLALVGHPLYFSQPVLFDLILLLWRKLECFSEHICQLKLSLLTHLLLEQGLRGALCQFINYLLDFFLIHVRHAGLLSHVLIHVTFIVRVGHLLIKNNGAFSL